MNFKRKRNLLVASLAALGTVAAATTAWAVFSASSNADATGTGGQLQAFTLDTPTTVYPNNEGALFPNHSANVTIVLTNPNTVAADVSSVEFVSVDVTGGTTPNNNATRVYCEGQIEHALNPNFSTNGAVYRQVPPNGAQVTLTIPGALTLKGDTDNRCMGMQFTSKWKVEASNA